MLPLFHPTTTVLVDDVPTFLESFKSAAPENQPIETFVSPERAIEHIRAKNEIARSDFARFVDVVHDTDRVVSENEPMQEVIARVSISRLNKKIEMPHRFDEVSVIICDYQMPSMKGTDFFEALGDIPQKRILLTGEADESVAVKAFNDGVIDKFLTKGRPGVVRELFGGIIGRYQRDYFRYQNSFASSIISLSESIFSHPGFDVLIQMLYQKYGFIEHYFVNFPDGALLIDEGPLRKRLVAFTDEDFDGILAVLRETPDVDPNFIKGIAERSIVPNESYGMAMMGDFTFWREMCQPAQIFEHAAGRMYYALFDVRDEIKYDNVRFFEDRMRT